MFNLKTNFEKRSIGFAKNLTNNANAKTRRTDEQIVLYRLCADRRSSGRRRRFFLVRRFDLFVVLRTDYPASQTPAFAIANGGAGSATFDVNFVWISSFTHPLFFCSRNPGPLICQSVEAEEMHSMVERGELAGIADKRGESDLRREEVVSLLAQLPPAWQKVLALYYHENMRCLI